MEEPWRKELPEAVRGLIGLAEGVVADDREERKSYHDYLEEKYA